MEPNLGRNDPCHCGSGKKYKQCHLAEDEAKARTERAKAAEAAPRPEAAAEAAARRPLGPEAPDATTLEEDRHQHARLRQDQPPAQGRRQLG